MLKKTASIFALLMIFSLLACKSGPAPQPDRLEMTPTMGALEALDGASPWLPDATAGVMIVSGPQGWRELESWLFPLADAALEPGSPGTAQGLSNDLTTLVEERLGFDLFELHTLVVGAHEGGASVVAFGDVELNLDLPTVEGPAGTVYELSLSRINQGVTDTEDQGFAAFSPSLFIYPIETPQPGLVFSLSPDAFETSNFLDSPVHKGLHDIIAGVDETSPTVLLAAMSSELPELAHTGMPEPESFVFSIGDLVTLAFQGPEATLDEIDAMIAAFLEELQTEIHREYEQRASAPLSDYLATIYGYHLIEGLIAQATPERTDEILRYDVALSERGWLAAMATSGLATRLAFSNMRSPGPRYENYPEIETYEEHRPPQPVPGPQPPDPDAQPPQPEFEPQPEPQPEITLVDSDALSVGDSYTRGPDDAAITIYEFSSFQCPFCTRGANTMKELLDEYPDEIRLVYKSFPLDFQQQSAEAAAAAQAAGNQGKFWEMHDLLYENQSRLAEDNIFEELASELDLDIETFHSDRQSTAVIQTVNNEAAAGHSIGVRGTPSFVINGEFHTGAQPITHFRAIIDRLLEDQ